METFFAQPLAETLLEYRVIDLSNAPFSDEEKNSWWEDTSPIELLGESALSVVFDLFKLIRGTVTEVTYRTRTGEFAYIIYSRTDPAVTIHPFDVTHLGVWSAEELKDLAKSWQTNLSPSSLSINLSELWKLAQETNKKEPETPFLEKLYRLNPQTDHVLITGKCPTALALYVFDWFLAQAKSVTYHA